MMGEFERKAVALAAASQASEAIGELIRYTREGPQYRRPPFGDIEVVEKLADALKMALEVEHAELCDGDDLGHPDDAEQRGQLLAACVRFLDGWMG